MNRLLYELRLQAYFLVISSPIWVGMAVAVHMWVVAPL